MKMLSAVVSGLVLVASVGSIDASAGDVKPKSIAALYQGKAGLAGKTVSAQGTVVKVNNGIMGRNWIHIKDGTGDAKSSELVVTSTQTAEVGGQVFITGVAAVNKDFGSGYSYALLIEDAKIQVKK